MSVGKLGISSYAYVHACRAGLSIPQLIDKAVAHQVAVVQIGDNINWDRFSSEDLLAARDYAEAKGITLETGFRGLLPEKISTYFRITKELNAKLMRIVVDAADFKPSESEIIEILSSMLPELEKSHMILGIENHDRFFSDQFRRIIEAIGSPNVAIILDTANASGKEEPLDHVLDMLAPYTVCFHAKNYRIIRRTIGMGFEIIGAKMAEGNLQVSKIIDTLNARSQYEFNVILELWKDACATKEQTLAEEEAWVTEALDYLRQYV